MQPGAQPTVTDWPRPEDVLPPHGPVQTTGEHQMPVTYVFRTMREDLDDLSFAEHHDVLHGQVEHTRLRHEVMLAVAESGSCRSPFLHASIELPAARKFMTEGDGPLLAPASATSSSGP